MPRASRHFLPGYVWHITHRCHQRKFLLKFARDRWRYLHWVFEAKKRYGLSVLNYVVTSNHIHLLVKDTGANVIAESMQLIAGRTAQEYNQRKGKQGAFWEDRCRGRQFNGSTVQKFNVRFEKRAIRIIMAQTAVQEFKRLTFKRCRVTP